MPSVAGWVPARNEALSLCLSHYVACEHFGSSSKSGKGQDTPSSGINVPRHACEAGLSCVVCLPRRALGSVIMPGNPAVKAADPFKAAVGKLRSALAADKKVQAGDATAKPEAIRLYMEAQALLDQALAKGGYPEKVLGIIQQKSSDVQKRLAKLGPETSAPPSKAGPPPMSQRGGAAPGAVRKQGPPPMAQTGASSAGGTKTKSTAPGTDPVKQAVALLKAASAQDQLIKGGDLSRTAEGLRLYNEALAYLEVVLASEGVSAKMKETFGKKVVSVKKRIKLLESVEPQTASEPEPEAKYDRLWDVVSINKATRCLREFGERLGRGGAAAGAVGRGRQPPVVATPVAVVLAPLPA